MADKTKQPNTLPAFRLGTFFILLFYKIFKPTTLRRFAEFRLYSMLKEVHECERKLKVMTLNYNKRTLLHLPDGGKVETKPNLSTKKEFVQLVHRVDYLKSQLVRYKIYGGK